MPNSEYYECADHINPHFSHTIMTWDDGLWLCTTCDGLMCDRCHEVRVEDEGDICAECVQEMWEVREQDYYDDLAKGDYSC